jgi:hypothetical protein
LPTDLRLPAKTSQWLTVTLFLLIGLSIVLRAVGLDHLPGISGDEAWEAVQARLWLRGEPYHWILPAARRLLTPTYILPVVLESPFQASGWLLRLPAFIAGALTAILAYPMLRRALPKANAQIAAAWIACLPLLIAYSRVGWECSQIPLAALVVTYFGLRKNWFGIVCSLLLAIMVHTINVFLVPIAVLPILYDRWRAKTLPSKPWLILIATGLLAVLAWAWHSVPGGPHLSFPGFLGTIHFVLGFSRLFSGVLAFGGFSAMPGKIILFFIDAAMIIAIPTLCLIRFKALDPAYRPFMASVGLSILALFLFGGPTAVSVGYERYSLFLAIPSIVVFALLWPTSPRSIALAYLLALGMLASFGVFYFLPMLQTGGSNDRPYRAGPTDPKVSAARWIIHDGENTNPLRIYAEDWWVYWVAYDFALAAGRRDHPVEMRGYGPETQLSEALESHTYLIGYGGGALEGQIRDLETRGFVFQEKRFDDYGGRPFIKVWRRVARQGSSNVITER